MPTKVKKVRIRDVAEAAGVSRAAVSLVLNNGAIRISKEKRATILEVADRLGYKPHVGARRLSLMRMETLGLVFPYAPSALTQLFLFELTRWIANEAKARSYDILIDFLHSAEPETLSADPGRVDGTILVRDRSTPGKLEHRLEASGHPCMVIGGAFMAKKPTHFVDFDILRGSYEVTRHLLELGHRDLVFFAGVASPVKYQGFQEAMAESNLSARRAVVLKSGMAESEIEKAVKRILAHKKPPTAIVAADDTLAIRTIRVLIRKGFSVPGDISVVGFDDIETADMVIPSVTTVRVPLKELAAVVVENLIRLINKDTTKPLQQVLPTEVVVRESSGPPPSATS